ncbi:MAG: hypothetical protein HYX97_06400, partial [Chloroflexi bacterium]|nr:hypothetical protein [Chloroflexota bacterium]
AKYNLLVKTVTPQSLRRYFGDWVQGEISVYPMPNIHALEIVLRKGLGGGATRTLRIDQTGKAMCEIVRRMEVEVPAAEAKKAGL